MKKVVILADYSTGGAVTMRKKVIQYLQEAGFEVSVAHYMPYRMAPELSVPMWRLLMQKPGLRVVKDEDGITTYQVGVRLPELEWARHTLSPLWQEVLDAHDYHMVVSGTVLPSNVILDAGKSCLAWIATPYFAERQTQISTYPLARKILVRVLDVSRTRRMEVAGLQGSSLLVLSNYTDASFKALAPGISTRLMRMPIDAQAFAPDPDARAARQRIRLGFAGRYWDPRKNIEMLLDAVALCRERGHDLELHLVGAEVNEALRAKADALGLTAHVIFQGFVDRRELTAYYQSLDLFVIPSFQEGLCIVGLEAMACGCPVVSTRCGGPEDFVQDDINGFLVDFDARQMADAIIKCVQDDGTWQRLSAGAVRTIHTSFDDAPVRSVFWEAFNETYKTHIT